MLLVQSAALGTLVVLNTLRGCQLGQDPLSHPLGEAQRFQGLVPLQKAVEPQRISGEVGDVAASAWGEVAGSQAWKELFTGQLEVTQ